MKNIIRKLCVKILYKWKNKEVEKLMDNLKFEKLDIPDWLQEEDHGEVWKRNIEIMKKQLSKTSLQRNILKSILKEL